ncbi:hypothetical protein BS78_10G038500 [Paspalum vaginatum]|nr:hypothetical protein BS78_10G038500 [Paspalum vaginatum]
MDHHPRRAAAGGIVVAPATTIVVLTVTCALAIHRAVTAGDAASVAFVAVSYGALLLLLRDLRAYELALAADAAERGPLRRRVWALSALLTAMFAWKVAAAVPWWPAAVIVWAAAAATSAA